MSFYFERFVTYRKSVYQLMWDICQSFYRFSTSTYASSVATPLFQKRIPYSVFSNDEKAFRAGTIRIWCEEYMYPKSALRIVRKSHIASRAGRKRTHPMWHLGGRAKNCSSPRQSWQILLWRTIPPRQREFRTSSSANPHQNFSIACLLLAFVALVQNWCRLDLLLLHMSIKSFRRVARLFPLCPRTVQHISYPIWAHSENTRDGCMLNTSLAMLSSISHWCSSTLETSPFPLSLPHSLTLKHSHSFSMISLP